MKFWKAEEFVFKIYECYTEKDAWFFYLLPTKLSSENGQVNVVPFAQANKSSNRNKPK